MRQKDDTDPVVMYVVVRESLGMSIGKTAAQCCHAVQHIMEMWVQYCDTDDAPVLTLDFETFGTIMDEWLTDSAWTKVVLGADEKEWERLLKDTESLTGRVIITDAGFTELEPGTQTVIAFAPMRKSDRPPCLKRLQVLK